MKRQLSDETIALLKCYRNDLGLDFPLRDDPNTKALFLGVLQYFSSLETSLSTSIDGDWTEEDFQLWDDVANAVDEFTLSADDTIDIDDLNRRMMCSV